ncbi:MAG: hypothetical protein AAGE59_15320 [Cyanobacteria bacterium P01_F01_bin.86]
MISDNSITPSNEVLEAVIQEIEQTPSEYLPNLLQIIRLFRESVILKPAEDSFRQGWHEAMTGQTLPLSELWTDIDAE